METQTLEQAPGRGHPVLDDHRCIRRSAVGASLRGIVIEPGTLVAGQVSVMSMRNDRSLENPPVLIPLGGPEAGGRTGLLRGTDRSLTVAAPFILA